MSSGAPLLEVNGIKRSFGDRAIIHGVSFSVYPGDRLFVRGASGVGKSLLLRALAYLDPIQVRETRNYLSTPLFFLARDVGRTDDAF